MGRTLAIGERAMTLWSVQKTDTACHTVDIGSFDNRFGKLLIEVLSNSRLSLARRIPEMKK
jgi:hypothetical protein